MRNGAGWSLLGILGVLIVSSPGHAQTRNDLYGDPLPDGALVRLGTVRFRDASDNRTLAFTPDGLRMAAAGGSPTMLWDVATGRPVRRFPTPHTDFGSSTLAVSPGGKFLAAAAGSADGRV